MKRIIVFFTLSLSITIGVFYSCQKQNNNIPSKLNSTSSQSSVTQEYSSDFNANGGNTIYSKSGDEIKLAVVKGNSAAFLIPKNKVLQGMKDIYDNKIEKHSTNFEFNKVSIINSDGVYGIRGYATDGKENIIIAIPLKSVDAGNSGIIIIVTSGERQMIKCSPSGKCVECADERYSNCPCHRTDPPTPGESCVGGRAYVGYLNENFQ